MKKGISLELDNDIDDFIAYKYLEKIDIIDYVVLSPYPKTQKGIELIKEIKKPIFKEIQPETSVVFVGGDFKSVDDYLKTNNTCLTVIANGGFVGENLEKRPLNKFRGKKEIRTFNFNMNIEAISNLIKNQKVKLILTGKNVCHSPKNTAYSDWWKNDKLLKALCTEYKVRDNKLQHDLLAFIQGYKKYKGQETLFNYVGVIPYMKNGNKGIYTEWGSSYAPRSNVCAAIFK